jgi:RHS repeat-associated protein
VGNRLTQEVAGGRVTQYAYDDANRLTGVDSQEYSWGENGNLVWDGVFSYTYDAANRLVRATNGITAVEYVYNGDGQRVAQVMGGVETRYTLDVAAALAQVLVEEKGGVATTYLYGLGRIAYKKGAADWSYYLHDGLGNVRAETSAEGVLLTVRRFSPFGEPIQGGDGGTPFGYTGEQWDGAASLLYLRARYYSPALGRFISKDIWMGSKWLPSTLNKWSYVRCNPVNLTDPSGNCDSDCCHDDRDLTKWLVEELRTSADGADAMSVKAPRLIGEMLLNPMYPQADWVTFFGLAYYRFYKLVEDGAKWDFKDRIAEEFGYADYPRGKERSIKLSLPGEECGYWFDYSLPGNIFFGFIGRAVGFAPFEIHAGASYAEIGDPDHPKYRDPWTFPIWKPPLFFGLPYMYMPPNSFPGSEYYNLLNDIMKLTAFHLNPEYAPTWFDDPGDYKGIEIGFELYETYKETGGVTEKALKQAIENHAKSLCVSPPSDAGEYRNERWPYHAGYFNGGK